jgi:ribonuclease P protein component
MSAAHAAPPDRDENGSAGACPAGSAFPRAARLLQPGQFKACFGGPQRLSGRMFRLHLAPSPESGARLGLAVSRKVSPRAVVRNRIKRVARETFRLARAGLPAVDVVLLAKREAATASSAELHAELSLLWRKLAALKPPPREGTMPGDAAT